MNINSESIQKKEFHVVFKGYKPEEVDKFLDILAVEFDRLQKNNRELMDNMERFKYEGDKESVEMKKVIQDALVSAHRVAEDIKRKAQQEAEEMVKSKVVEEEEHYKKMLARKLKLEEEIKRLDREYENFRGKITRLVDDFKESASKLEEGKLSGISGIKEEESPDLVEEISEETAGESKQGKDLIYSPESEDEFEVFKSEEESEEKEGSEENKKENPELENLKEEEEKEDEGEEDIVQDSEGKIGVHGDSEEIEEIDDNYQPKRMKKKIDIANPDIINDFFKTDED
jgi:cell division initiation protein